MDVLKPTSTLPKSDIDLYLDELKKKLKISDKKLREIVNRLNDTNKFDGLHSIAHFIFDSIHSDDATGVHINVDVEEFVSLMINEPLEEFIEKSYLFWELTSKENPLNYNTELESILNQVTKFNKKHRHELISYGISNSKFEYSHSLTKQLINLYPIPKYGKRDKINKNLEDDDYWSVLNDQLHKYVNNINTQLDIVQNGDMITIRHSQLPEIAEQYFQVHPGNKALFSNPFSPKDVGKIEYIRGKIFDIRIYCLEACQDALKNSSYKNLLIDCINYMSNSFESLYDDIVFLFEVEKKYENTNNFLGPPSIQSLPIECGGLGSILYLIQYTEEQSMYKTKQKLKSDLISITSEDKYRSSHIHFPNYLSMNSNKFRRAFDEAAEKYFNEIHLRNALREDFAARIEKSRLKYFKSLIRKKKDYLPAYLHEKYQMAHDQFFENFKNEHKVDISEDEEMQISSTADISADLIQKGRRIEFKHNEDFTSIKFSDENYLSLGKTQAKIIKVLYEETVEDGNYLHNKEISRKAGYPEEKIRVQDYFSSEEKRVKYRIDKMDKKLKYRLNLDIPRKE